MQDSALSRDSAFYDKENKLSDSEKEISSQICKLFFSYISVAVHPKA